MRVGVEAGEVLVDLDRASGSRDRMLTGDAVNTASRLQSAAEPGRVVVGPTTYAATKTVIDYRELPALALKGKAEPVAAWEALRVKARRRGEPIFDCFACSGLLKIVAVLNTRISVCDLLVAAQKVNELDAFAQAPSHQLRAANHF